MKRKKRTLPVLDEGYTGTGMCAACFYSDGLKGSLVCGWYGKRCKTVCRNCSGIRILKTEKENRDLNS